MKKHQLLSGLFAATLAIVGFAAQTRAAELIYGMTGATTSGTSRGINLVSFTSTNPGTFLTNVPFSGVISGHNLRSMDFRPATGQLYAISTDVDFSTAAQLYTVNLVSGALTPVGPGFVLGTGINANTEPTVEMEFNPVVDRIRIVTGAEKGSGQHNNFRADPNTGLLVNPNDTDIGYDPSDPNAAITYNQIVAIAYSNNVNGATTTTLYGWDYGLDDNLVTIGGLNGNPSPNLGALFSVNLPFTFLAFNKGIGMDISGATGVCYVSHGNPIANPQTNPPGSISALYTRNVSTGAETKIGNFPSPVNDISVTTAVATAAGVTISGHLLLSNGRGIVNATVKLTGPDGSVRTAITTAGGAYMFEDVEAGSTYILTASGRNYAFESPSTIISLTDSLTDIDFVGRAINVSR